MSKEPAKQGSARCPEAVQCAGKEPRCQERAEECEIERRGGKEAAHLCGHRRSPLTAPFLGAGCRCRRNLHTHSPGRQESAGACCSAAEPKGFLVESQGELQQGGQAAGAENNSGDVVAIRP